MPATQSLDPQSGQQANSPEEKASLEAQGYAPCANVRCNFMHSPQIMEHYSQLADEVLHGQADPQELWYTCPLCGHYYNIMAQPGAKGQKRLAPGGTTHSGLDPAEQGQIAEDLVEKLGQGDFAGYGPFKWWHHGGANANSALDGMLENWGVEVKAIDWAAKNHRFIVNDKAAADKNQAAQDPRLFAEKIGDPKLDAVLDTLDVKGVLGVLVILDFSTSLADVYVREFPYGQWGTNNQGNPIKGVRHFRTTAAIKAFGNVPFDNPLPDPNSEGFVPHSLRPADTAAEFGAFANTRYADDYAGDSHPASEPQSVADQEARHSPNEWELGPKVYQFFYGNGRLEVSPQHSHSELRDHAGIKGDHTGPLAVGHVTVDGQRATWEVDTNVGLGAFKKILSDYTDQVGWKWGGLTNAEGEPVSDDFAPKKSVYYAYTNDHLYLSNREPLQLLGGVPRVVTVQGKTLRVDGLDPEAFPAIKEWADDEGLRVVAGNDNVIKTIEDLQQWNFSDPNKGLTEDNKEYDRQPGGVFKCPDCSQIFPTWGSYIVHRKSEQASIQPEQEDGHFPEMDENPIQDAHTSPQQPTTFPIARVTYIHKTTAKPVEPKDMIEDNVPFIYDIEGDNIYVGAPGSRHSDIHGKFTPGGIVEGTYQPGGKVSIRTMTNMPYTVRHMIDLWYAQHPEFEIRGVELEDNDGNTTKLAAEDYGHAIRTLAYADPAVKTASNALQEAGGKVYVVGGAVRDLLLGKQPKDIDLMVAGIPSEGTRKALEALPGRVDLTGKDFGVYRYRHAGNEVEIALPRRERSTGSGHQDFDVQTDHTMPVEEDLERRDFTANAIAVDLHDGKLIDPFNGAEDIKNGTLRTVSHRSFEEDPLRVARALVAHSRHGLTPDDETKRQMAKSADGLTHLPAERIQAELDKIFASDDPAKAIELAHDTGVLGHILPEVEQAWDFDQNNPHHNHPLGKHLIEVLKNVTKETDDPDLRLAALLHDIGKPGSAWTNPETGFNHYYRGPDGQGADHEHLGAELAQSRLQDLRYPKGRVERIHGLITHHMFPAFGSERGARKFLNRTGEHADDLLTLREADMGGKGTDEYQASKTPVSLQRELVEQARSTKAPTALSELAINGSDLIAAGMTPGPQMGQVLNDLVQKVVENPALNTKDKLLEMAMQ